MRLLWESKWILNIWLCFDTIKRESGATKIRFGFGFGFFPQDNYMFFLRDHFLYRSLEHINGIVKKQSNHILWTGFGSVSLRIFWSTSSIRDRKAIFDWAIFPRDGFEILISGQENVIVFLHRFVIIDLYGKWLIMWIINRENNKSKSFCFYYK